ncbi:hypothetical protein IIA15_10075, partial [candidate division TA06 bacterium]|nr:hypothetical protein [candidate division TA06 bacterium]
SLFSIVIFALLASGFIFIGVRNTQMGSDLKYSAEALSSAEAGVHFALGQMNAEEILPPEPDLNESEADSIWRNWVHPLETPGYGSEVEISYVVEKMLPLFDSTTGKIAEEDKYYRITSSGYGSRSTHRKVEVVASPQGEESLHFLFGWQFGGDVEFSGNPITFSGHSDTLIVKLDPNKKPWFDMNNNGVLDSDEWEWEGNCSKCLEAIEYSDPYPDGVDDDSLIPPLLGLHSAGDIHANGNITLGKYNGGPTPHFNGTVTAAGYIFREDEEDTFFFPSHNKNDYYIRNDAKHLVAPQPDVIIPTDQAFWEKKAEKDSTIHVITEFNYYEHPGWEYKSTNKGPKFTWKSNEDIPEGTYYLAGHVKITGSTAGNASIVTDYTLELDGNPGNTSTDNLVAYICRGNIDIQGNQYIQGLLYTSEGNIEIDGQLNVFGSVYIGADGEVSGDVIVVYDTALQNLEGILPTPKPVIVSWQEVYDE